MIQRMSAKKWIRRIVIIIFWIALWQTLSFCIGNDIVFVGPIEVLQTLLRQTRTLSFWKTIASSFSKISLGFLMAFVSGLVLGAIAYKLEWVRSLLEPLIAVIKSIPVASFVILALIWMGSRNLSIFIAYTIVFPTVYINAISGLESTDPKLLEMAEVFHISRRKRIQYIYRSALLPYLISGCRVALGMCWKAGIAAEVIGVPEMSIGEQLYMSKIYLSTDELFAWTVVTVIVSVLFEKLFLFILKLFQKGSRVKHERNILGIRVIKHEDKKFKQEI